ncbi:MAG: Gfo/Idh/MocA family oxidoreductase [Candidatus Latescibacteria bacterium]|nr:Gfo/Idh/MocA family oxidoreductase [Candidatus Latescibacterota bacterium]
MSQKKHSVAIIGCGRMGQEYARAYAAYPDTEIVAIAEYHPERRKAVGERFGVEALYPDAPALLRDIVPDIAAVVTPVKYTKEAVIACAEAGVKGVSADKPLAAVLSDADEMVETCAARGVVFGGGNLQRAMNEVQEAARRIRSGAFGALTGASVHGFGGEISGGGCQHISVLRLFAGAEVEEVTAWGTPEEALAGDTDDGLIIHGRFRMTSGLECPVFGTPTPSTGVEVWSEDALVRWNWAPPEVFQGFDANGRRIRLNTNYAPYSWSEFGYLTGSIRSLIATVETGSDLWISGHDLRQALEVAIAAKLSAMRDSAPVRLPLQDRSLSLYPRPYRWLGGDATGQPQSAAEAKGGA